MGQRWLIRTDGSARCRGWLLEGARCSRGSEIESGPLGSCIFLLFENSKAIADFDTKAVSKIDQKWRILTRRRSVKSISWNASGSAEGFAGSSGTLFYFFDCRARLARSSSRGQLALSEELGGSV